LYSTLDRNADTGTLRPSQEAILSEWNQTGRNKRDLIVKLHTGQGKTLVGLLILQARLNENKGPVVYLCPNNFLIEQTCEQAKRFGIQTCTSDGDLPEAFLNSEQIFVTSVQKLFNGLTKFGLDRHSITLGTLLMDDAHACADAIRVACQMRIESDDPAYLQIRTLFAAELEQQGIGTFADIANGKRDALLPIPYWAWIDRETDVAAMLSGASARKSVKFAWPLLRNILRNCQCLVSGTAVEIEPFVAPLNMFGSYWKAEHRVFMSATVTDDAFLIKGLQLTPETILNPLTYSKQQWSGEKMVLIPSIIHNSLNREAIVAAWAPPDGGRDFGVVALATSFQNTKDWERYKATVATKETVWTAVANIRNGSVANTLVLVNRYDGIDLPDDSCRILIFDGKPYSESLIDSYEEECRPESDATLMRQIRTVEQGMGRSVRGEKDYSAIVVVGPELTRLLRDLKSRGYLSSQMATQIEIGLKVAEFAREEIADGKDPFVAFNDLIRQSLRRDGSWKTFYSMEMEAVKPTGSNGLLLDIYGAELQAELAWMKGDYDAATKCVQTLLNTHKFDSSDIGWYLQMMARFNYPSNRAESSRLQLAAHNSNRMVMRPPQGFVVTKLELLISQGRVERIANWIRSHGNYAQLQVALGDILGRLVFGVKADKFEQALDELSRALGFAGERPDKEWKEGPDNLWALDDVNYIIWECKSEVQLNRAEINKSEAEQMNRSAAWFMKHYQGCKAMHIEIHPALHVQSAGHFLQEVFVMRDKELKSFVQAASKFFASFEHQNFSDLSLPHIQNLLNSNALSVENLLDGGFVKKTVNIK
jgi:replicative superfamily II helicase